jgi:hypothetical protein
MKRKLPKYVTAFFDRHSKERFRYRKGAVSIYLRGPFNSPEFKGGSEGSEGGRANLYDWSVKFPARSTTWSPATIPARHSRRPG